MIRIDPILITLGIMVASAALVLGVAWFVLATFLSLAQYIPSGL